MFSAGSFELLRKFTINNYCVDLGDMTDSNWSVTFEFHPVGYQNNMACIFYDCLGYTDFSEIVIEQGAVLVDGRDTYDRIVNLELIDKVYCSDADNASI